MHKMDTSTQFMPPISSEESVRSGSPEQVYRAFYEAYGGPEFQDALNPDVRFRHVPMIDGRVLHIDGDPPDRSVHLIVREPRDVRIKGLNTIADPRSPEGLYGYDTILTYEPDHFVVVTSDGQHITRWNVREASGTLYGDLLDPINNPYDPRKVEYTFSLFSDEGDRATLTYNRNNKKDNGTMLINGVTGWILNEHESREQREVVLHPAPDDVAELGHTALAA